MSVCSTVAILSRYRSPISYSGTSACAEYVRWNVSSVWRLAPFRTRWRVMSRFWRMTVSPEGSHAQGTVPERNFSGMGSVSCRWAVVRVKQSGQRCCSLSRRCWQLQPVNARTEKKSNGKIFLCMSKKSCIFAAEKERWLIQVARGAAQGQPPLFLFIFPARYTMWCEYSFLPNTTKGFMHSINGFSRTSCFDLFRFCFDFLYQIIWACIIFLFMQGCLSPFSNSV